MTITLPVIESQHRPLTRILVSPSWGSGFWTELPMAPRWDIAHYSHGFEVVEHDRGAFPTIGQATFLFRFGTINGRIYGTDTPGGIIGAQDLQGYVVRIQQCDGPTNSQLGNGLLNIVLNWRTVWIGTVELQTDTLLPSASEGIGLRRYHCLDIFHYASRWPLQFHGYQGRVCKGSLGYNMMLSDGTISGDMDSSHPVSYASDDPGSFSHTQRGQGDLWTDMDVVNDALLNGRLAGDPIFQITEDYGLLQGAQFWPTSETQNAMQFCQEVLKRQRGRGMAYIDWDSDESNPTGPIALELVIVPQVYADIVYDDPVTQEEVTLPGAATAGTAWEFLDLIGDHRVIDTTFLIGSRYFNAYGYVEDIGEPIEVFTTVSYADASIEQRWTGSPTSVTIDPEDEAIYQLHSTPINWDITSGDGTGTKVGSIAFQCNDDGSVTNSGLYDTSPIVSTHNIEILKDTCIPAAGDEMTGTLRGFPQAYVNVPIDSNNTNPDLWIDIKGEIGASLSLRPDGMLLKAAGDEKGATRRFSNIAEEDLGADYNFTSLAFSVTLRLPHRVRMADGDPQAARRKVIEHRNIRLWLCDPNAITGLNYATGDADAGHSPLRADVGTMVDGIAFAVVDDRSKLALLHALAVSWYGTPRQTASWQIRGSGLLDYFLDINGNEIPYITLGSVLNQLGIAGGTSTVQTPVTHVHYDAVRNVTTWSTDWSDLDTSL
jgi:hypothetical protein